MRASTENGLLVTPQSSGGFQPYPNEEKLEQTAAAQLYCIGRLGIAG